MKAKLNEIQMRIELDGGFLWNKTCIISLAMKKKMIVMFLFSTLTLAPHNSKAGFVEKISGCAAMLAEEPFKKLVANFANKTMNLHDKQSGKAFQLVLGKRLGAGFFGGVYIVKDITGLDFKLDPLEPLIVKIPHSWKFSRKPKAIFFTEKENRKELELYNIIMSQLPAIEASPKFPKNPYWEKGHLPIAAIKFSAQTEMGTLLFKPLLKGGTSLTGLAEKFRDNGNKLDYKYEKAIHDIYDLAQAIEEATVLPKHLRGLGGKGLSPDIRPTNFNYMSGSPQELGAYGLNVEGFMTFEMSQVPYNRPQYIERNTPFKAFLEEYVGYLLHPRG